MTKEVLLSVIVKAEQSLCGIVSLHGRDGVLFTLYLIMSAVMVSWYQIVYSLPP